MQVFSTHLQSVMFDNYHYKALYDLKILRKQVFPGSKAIAYRLRNAYVKRAWQASMVNQKVTVESVPGGRMRRFSADVPNSYSYFTARGDLQDAFRKRSGLANPAHHFAYAAH